MNKTINKTIRNHAILGIVTVLGLLLIISGTSYALFQDEYNQESAASISVGTLSFSVDDDALDETKQLILEDIYPVKSNNDTDKIKGYTFKIKNTGTYKVRYDVYLEDITQSVQEKYQDYKILDERQYKYIDYKINKEDYKNNLVKNSVVHVITGILEPNEETDENTIKFWLDETSPNEINGSIVGLNIKATATAI